MTNFLVVILSEKNSSHSAAFIELAMALVESIRYNGHTCELVENQFDPKCIHIILGYHLIVANSIPTGMRYVVYQLEQLSESEGIFFHRPQILEILARAEQVWEYSPENVAFLARHGISATLIPVGYSSVLNKIPQSPKDIDILFYGSRNERRTAILQELLNRGYRVKALFGLYGEERDHWISRASLVMNIHYYEANLFESVRVSYLITNGIPVLSEISPSYPWELVPLVMCSYTELVDRAEQLLADRLALAKYGIDCQFNLGANYAMNNTLRVSLSSF